MREEAGPSNACRSEPNQATNAAPDERDAGGRRTAFSGLVQPLRRADVCWLLLLLVVLPLTLQAQTVTWGETWESPAAQDDWYADNGVWGIGVPTSGPPPGTGGWRAYEGTNCAATVLGGNYPTSRTSRLISSPILVPVAALNPRLRFWHWWSFETGAFGQVQISTNNGASWQGLPGGYGSVAEDFTYTSSGRWSRAWVDLTQYAGRTVLLGLYFKSSDYGPSDGWYVDDLVIETGPPEPGLSLPEGFEGGWGGWKAQYAGGLATDFAIWEIGKPTSGPGSAHGGTNCAATILSGDYPTSRRSRLVSPPLTVPDASANPRLRFWHWWSFEAGAFGQVQISTNNGASWIDLSSPYTTSGGEWLYSVPLSLSAYAGQTVTFGLYFESSDYGPSSGWYVDDIAILATHYPPMITAQPASLTVVAGNAASFSVAVSPLSDSPLTYQWRFKGVPIPDATNATYTIPSAATNHASCCGQGYDVVITNPYGVATSVPPAELTVLVLPSIATHPQSQTVPVGSDVTFSVAATGTEPLSYQWRSNGVAIAGATASSLVLRNVELTQSGTLFVVVVNNAGGSATSDEALLTVLPACGAFVGHDVGDVGAAGSFSRSECQFTVRGSGEDIEDTADAFQFVHQPLIGDGQIVARVLGIEGADPRAEAGLMMRESLDAGGRHVLLALKASKSVAFRRRLALNTYSVEYQHQGTNATWLRLMRLGNTFVAHASTNGLNWQYVWFTTLDLPSPLEVGLAVTAHSYGLMAMGRFDNVSLGGLTPLGPWPEEGSRIYLGGEPLGTDGLEPLGGFKVLVGGVVGDAFSIRTSPHVSAPDASWSDLGTVTNRWGVVDFLDAQALAEPLRFYRAFRVGP